MSDEYWVKAMQEKLALYQKNDVCKLVEFPKGKFVDEAKWVCRNKFDETCKVGRNKVKVVAKGYSQQEGIDYTETFALVARVEEIRILLSFVAHHGMMLHQMDVKNVFLNRIIKEEVYGEKPLGLRVLSTLIMFSNLTKPCMD